jgi:hypothetical protein
MVAAMASKIMVRSYLQWHDVTTEFHKNLPTGSRADRGKTHRRHGDHTSLQFSFRKESRLKMGVVRIKPAQERVKRQGLVGTILNICSRIDGKFLVQQGDCQLLEGSVEIASSNKPSVTE